jgi:hypothetical protein
MDLPLWSRNPQSTYPPFSLLDLPVGSLLTCMSLVETWNRPMGPFLSNSNIITKPCPEKTQKLYLYLPRKIDKRKILWPEYLPVETELWSE